jgi:hypothetical protein
MHPCCICLLAIYLFLPPLSSAIDPATAADAPVIDYVTDDPSSFSPELLGKQIPLIIPVSPIPSLLFLH